jgi:hypothetical protein
MVGEETQSEDGGSFEMQQRSRVHVGYVPSLDFHAQ